MLRAAAILLLALAAACTPAGRIERFPDTIQSNSYSCGVGAVQAVLQYYGHWGYQDKYAKEMGTSPEEGTNPASMIACLRKRGLDARLVEGLTVEDLRRYVDEGVPVIVDFQAWNGAADHDYSKEWEDGHYGIVVGYEGDLLLIEDPSLLGTLGTLRADELERRWRDYENEAGKRREYRRSGIVVRGKADPPPPLTPIE